MNLITSAQFIKSIPTIFSSQFISYESYHQFVKIHLSKFHEYSIQQISPDFPPSKFYITYMVRTYVGPLVRLSISLNIGFKARQRFTEIWYVFCAQTLKCLRTHQVFQITDNCVQLYMLSQNWSLTYFTNLILHA